MIFDIIAFIVITISVLLCSIKYIHIFQLNSYAHDTQKRWFKNNTKKLIPNIVFPLLGSILLLISPVAVCIVFVFAGIFNRYKKAKKPVVFTARVKRLLLTIMLISVILPLIFFIMNTKLLIICSLIVYLLNPLMILIGDTLNAPAEKAVKQYYINDAKKILSSSNASVIGVTGSYGKTSVKYYLNSLLNSQFDTLMTPESFNTPMGVVKTIRESMNARHEYFICEMGARRVGDIKEICDIVNPDFGIITSVGPQHLETFGSIENVTNTKFELADALSQSSVLFLNGDNEYISNNIKNYKEKRKVITYGIGKENDYRFEVIKVSSKGTEFSVIHGDNSYTYSTKLIGEHNVLNITVAIAVADTLGISPEKLVIPVKRLNSVAHRLELSDNGKAIIIDDAYNSNPAGAKAALDTLALFEEYKILITPGMVELGNKQYECNKTFGSQAAKVCDYIILVGKKQAEPILDGMGDFPEEKYFVADTVTEAINHAYALNTTDKKKVILLENDLPDNYLA